MVSCMLISFLGTKVCPHLCSSSTLPDFSLPFVVETNASDFAIGGVFTQADQPVAYFSMMLNST